MRHLRNLQGPGIVIAWLVAIASGALTTSLLRVPVGLPGIGSVMLTTHAVVGAAVGLAAIVHLAVLRQTSRVWSAALVGATLVSGWLSSRSFVPLTVAAHATFGAVASVALAAYPSGAPLPVRTSGSRRQTWTRWAADLAFVLVLLQVGLGAFLRHHVIGLTPHLLVGGLAALMILVPAVAISQDSTATVREKRASSIAISALLVQVSLGVVVLFMIWTGSTNVQLWLVTTITHVVTGTLTLLAVASLASLLRASPSTDAANPRPATD